MKRYWIGVASRQHVLIGVAGGFAQLCHGKERPLKRMSKNDWIIYYSPQEILGEKTPCQRFTAIGEVSSDEVYQVEMAPGFIPFRRDIRFSRAKEIPIRPLIDQLSFIKDKKQWGYVFRFGHLQIPETDFRLIAEAMSVNHIEESGRPLLDHRP
jgi:predicted RNA-binding protein